MVKKFICIAKCPELDNEGARHCVDTEEGILNREGLFGDYCPAGNREKWVELDEGV